MKSIMKRSLSLVLVLIMAFSMSIGALAADVKTISVQIDGKNLEMKYAPVVQKGTTYVDYRSVLEAMGAEVSYNYQKNELTSVLNDKTTVIKESIVTTDGPFVSVRAAAQSAGYIVNWDPSTKTVILMNIDKLLERYKGKFTIMDKYMAYAAELASQNIAITGTMDINMKMSEGDKTNKMSMKCKIDAISNQDVADMNLNMAADLTEILKNEDMSKVDEMAMKMLKELGNTNIRYIVNLKDGQIYLQSKLISMMAKIPEDSWLSIDFNELLKSADAEFDMASLLKMSKSKSFDEYLSAMVHAMPLTDSDAAAEIIKGLDMMESFIGDKAMVKKGDDYVASFKMDESGVNVKGDFILNMKNDKVVGYVIDANAAAMGSDVFKLNAKQGSNDIVMKMSITIPSMLEANYDIVMNYSKTDKTPMTKPADGSKIISVNDMLKGLEM